MADLLAEQANFGGGIFRGRRAPADSVYDCVNGLVSDERELFRRGGSAIKSGSDAGAALLGLWDGHTTAGPRTVFWSSGNVYALDSNDSSIISLDGSVGEGPPVAVGRGVEIGGLVFFQAGNLGGVHREVVYGGSRKASFYGTGTLNAAAVGATVVTGTGTSWLANVDPGMILRQYGIVKSVESNTSLTLTQPLGVAISGGTGYSLDSAGLFNVFNRPATSAFHAVAGQRLIRTMDNRAYFSRPASDPLFLGDGSGGDMATMVDNAADYHELPRAALITGADSIEDTLILFTTNGVWAISNLTLDTFNDVGDIQHQVAQISQDVILWGDPGIAAYQGALIVPAVDDVYAFTLGAAPVPVSAGIRPLYREYVEAGYKPGIATVYRGHYFLPVLDGSNAVVDTFVCRLDLRDSDGSRRPAWTRWANGGSGRAYATRVGATARTPKLLGLDGLRVSDLTGCFDPDATRKDDADGTDHALTVTTNDFDTGPGLRGHTVLKALLEMQLEDAASDNPTVALSHAVGLEGASFTAATVLTTGASTAGESDGTTPSAWDVRRKCERIRIKIQTSGAAASAILRRLELQGRINGRR